jgi:diaminopimelate epimerase
MKLNFFKYHGNGNDFIMIDNRIKNFIPNAEIIKNLCDRHFGIGADGLILLENAKDYDFKMLYYNSDGKEGTMCGNGGRCIVSFAKKLGIIKDNVKFIAVDGEHFAEINKGSISLKMQDVVNFKTIENNYLLDTGSPHFVQFVDDINDVDIYNKGKEIRNSKIVGEGGANVNFAQVFDKVIKIGTYERGVENETLSCGTGSTAVAIAAYLNGGKKKTNFDIETKGGMLHIKFDENNNIFSNIWLSGPTKFVFKAKIKIKY